MSELRWRCERTAILAGELAAEAAGFDEAGVEFGGHEMRFFHDEAIDPTEPASERPTMTFETGFSAGTYDRCSMHWFEPSVAECKDCHGRVCVNCVVDVRGIGIFCRPCALIRAGVRAKTSVAS